MTRITVSAVTIAVILDLKGCSGMSARDRNTVIGASVGDAAVSDAIGKAQISMIRYSLLKQDSKRI
ncbi:MAG: prenyltransferase [Nitrosomonas sp.]|uniref:prenyltransferase n=1 Tax=Nitrosomonas sp. TaxID=42353 RepID=UPI002732DEDA|nr:prenyltransferase [Nitrosomonas sp.]MDP3282619.1 prenyltransferase [Nitrosomonas sp.]